MSETKILKLFKHDEPLETNENQFDIDLALNQNWNKIDEFAEKVNTKTVELENKQKQHDTDISTIKQEQQDQNSKIENNTTQNEEQADLLNQIVNILPATTGEGEYVTLQDTAEIKFKKFEMQGNSKQNARKGYNLLNVEKEFSVTGSNLIKITLAAGTYTIKFDDANTSNNSVISYVFAFYANGSALSYQHVAKESKKKTFNLSSNIDEIRIWSADSDSESKGVTTTYKNLMIYAGSEDKEYEEYGASPSPEYPSEIKNVDKANVMIFNKNLFDGELSQGYDNNGNISGAASYVCNTNLINVKENEKYTISNNLNLSINSISYYKDNKFVRFQRQLNLYTITIPKNINQIRFNLTKSPELRVTDFTFCQFEKGDKATNKTENKQQSILFPFTEGQRLYKGDYLAEDGIHRRIREFIIIGTEKIFDVKLIEKGKVLFNLYCVGLPGEAWGDSPIRFCNIFNKSQFKKWGSLTETATDGIATFTDQVKILCNNVFGIVTEDDLETRRGKVSNWIKQNNIVLDIELEKEEIEPYTPEQKEAYNKLKKLHSYNEQTNIFSTNVVSPVFNIEAIKNPNATFAQLSITMLERS